MSTKEKVQSMDWFDRNIKFRLEDWETPICSRCQDYATIVVEAFGYGSVYHLCPSCAQELDLIQIDRSVSK